MRLFRYFNQLFQFVELLPINIHAIKPAHQGDLPFRIVRFALIEQKLDECEPDFWLAWVSIHGVISGFECTLAVVHYHK